VRGVGAALVVQNDAVFVDAFKQLVVADGKGDHAEGAQSSSPSCAFIIHSPPHLAPHIASFLFFFSIRISKRGFTDED
jgi:hypothetical protein